MLRNSVSFNSSLRCMRHRYCPDSVLGFPPDVGPGSGQPSLTYTARIFRVCSSCTGGVGLSVSLTRGVGQREKKNLNKQDQLKCHEGQTTATYTLGSRKAKNWLTPGRRIAQTRPTSRARKVDAGIVGSSVLATADQTSAYGESSCTIESVGPKLRSPIIAMDAAYVPQDTLFKVVTLVPVSMRGLGHGISLEGTTRSR
ncbi:hypothetical protein BC826DRAFT_433376 [Russula brevipes]|nr:hypothetical protein BC826DRAFT_433376 [Russula brevipes]